jgi:hypothetical protein
VQQRQSCTEFDVHLVLIHNPPKSFSGYVSVNPVSI